MPFRGFRPIDNGPSPGRNVPGLVLVRIVGVPIGHAAELGLRWTIGFVLMLADRTRAARIPGIDHLYSTKARS